MATSNAQSATPQTLRIIRFALLAGLLIFGAIAFYMANEGGMGGAGDEEFFSTLLMVFFGLAAAEGAVMYLIHRRWKQAETFQQKANFSIIGWALAEGLALFGGVILLLGGSTLPYLCGLVFFGVAWMLFPVREEADAAPRG